MRVVCISDTHGQHQKLAKLPEGDLLIHAGDFTTYGVSKELRKFNKWLGEQPFKHKIVIAGNHDKCMEKVDNRIFFTNAHYLHDSAVEIEGFKFYGSPYTPIFFNWSFMDTEEGLAKRWEQIPDDTDVLITHGPMYPILDYIDNGYNPDVHVGSKSLYTRINQIYPKWHICGHIHSQHGVDTVCNGEQTRQTHCINASVLDEDYNIAYEPIAFNL